MTQDKLTTVFCAVDDFCMHYENVYKKQALENRKPFRGTPSNLAISEVISILILFHPSGFRTFKQFYLHLRVYHKGDFPYLVSYTRFVELIPSALIPLCSFLKSRFVKSTGINFIDSTPLRVCRNKRIKRNKVFKDIAAVGKSTMGWFFGFKLHIVTNEFGHLLSAQITAGNVDDRKPVPKLAEGLWGKLFADKGYISKKLFNELFENGVKLITSVRKGMKNRLMEMEDKILLRKRSVIETINDQLKNISQVEHSRHRSPTNAMVNIIAGLVAYTFQEKKPRINWSAEEQKLINTALIVA